MKSDMTVDTWLETPYGRAAMRNFGPVSPDFRMYEVEWLEWSAGVKVKGAIFRKAKFGKNKGRMCVMVPGTERVTYVTRDEIEKYSDENVESGKITVVPIWG